MLLLLLDAETLTTKYRFLRAAALDDIYIYKEKHKIIKKGKKSRKQMVFKRPEFPNTQSTLGRSDGDSDFIRFLLELLYWRQLDIAISRPDDIFFCYFHTYS